MYEKSSSSSLALMNQYVKAILTQKYNIHQVCMFAYTYCIYGCNKENDETQ